MGKEEEQARQMPACVEGLSRKRMFLQRAFLGNWKERQYGLSNVVRGGKPRVHLCLPFRRLCAFS